MQKQIKFKAFLRHDPTEFQHPTKISAVSRQHMQDYKWEPVFYCTGTPGAGDRKSIIIRKSKKYTIFLNFSQLNCQICLTDEQPYNMLWQISVRLRIERNL